MTATGYRVGVVGATGLLGGEVLRLLAQRRFPVRTLHVFASDRSVGEHVPFGVDDLTVERPTPAIFKFLDLVFLAAGREVNTQVYPHARSAGNLIINATGRENASETTPLVIPEVNIDVLDSHPRIVACPHDLTIQLCTVLAPLHRQNPVRRVTLTALVAVGAAGVAAMRELTEETQTAMQGKEPIAHLFPPSTCYQRSASFMRTDTRVKNGCSHRRRGKSCAPRSCVSPRLPYGCRSINPTHKTYTRSFPASSVRRMRGASSAPPPVSVYRMTPPSRSTRIPSVLRGRTASPLGVSATIRATRTASCSGARWIICAKAPPSTPYRSPKPSPRGMQSKADNLQGNRMLEKGKGQ